MPRALQLVKVWGQRGASLIPSPAFKASRFVAGDGWIANATSYDNTKPSGSASRCIVVPWMKCCILRETGK
ncbi:hypothetical protein GCM10023156_11550 [Novipirellula rosea]|uniref:Uncharacterized protein n=1 Tax=Novipirellula rosea TaxID=1031540 RepID=A0ABP8MCK0_9BACT